MTDTARNRSSSLRRALDILGYVRDHAGVRGVSLSDLSDALSLNKSTILRLAAPLCEETLLVRDPDGGRFRLGTGALRLGQAYLSTVDLRTAAAGPLRALQRACRQTCHLAVPDGTHVVYIDKVEDSAHVRMASRVGSRAPAHCTAVGKAMLAADPSMVDTVVAAGLPAYTPNTVTDPAALRAELDRVRRRGYAVDDQEHELDVRCAAVPVFDHEGRLAGALSVSGLASRLTAAAVAEVAPLLVSTGADVSRRLGAPDGTGPTAVPERTGG